MNKHDDIYQDVIDYIRKEADSVQTEKVEAWINADNKNKKDYRQLVQTSYKLKLSDRWYGIQDSSAKDQLIQHMKKKKRLMLYRYTSIAASIILIISFGLVFYVDKMQQEVELMSANELVHPGEFKATLTLSTGEKVILTDNKIDSIADVGHFIQHDVEGGINYSTDSKATVVDRKITYNTLKVARGEEYKIVLADGTNVWLNADSELKYPVQFSGKQRTIFLKGEAYFDVTHNKNKAFVVHSHDQQVKVYGTEFCVDAYTKEEIKTVLVEGSVGVKASKYGNEVKLKPGELGRANTYTGETKVEKVNVRPYIAWKDGDFVFEHERLESIMMKLERWYNVKIFYMNEECKEYRFTGDVKRYDDIQNILKFIQITSKAKFEVNKNTITVMAK